MDPSATLERIRQAYLDGEPAELTAAVDDLVEWIKRTDTTEYTVSEPQLSALLIMARANARAQGFGWQG